VPEKIIGTLTSSILKSVHTSISPVFSYKSYSVATPGHPEPLPLENHVRIIALTPDLQSVSFYSVIDFLLFSTAFFSLSLDHDRCFEHHHRHPRFLLFLYDSMNIFPCIMLEVCYAFVKLPIQDKYCYKKLGPRYRNRYKSSIEL